MKWITHDQLGEIAFPTKKSLKEKYPNRKPVFCNFTFSKGWLALDVYGTDVHNTIKTPDGREIPVVSGWCEKGCLIGMRGGQPNINYTDYWKVIMNRAIEYDLTKPRT
jgi:hypothetical protein